MFDDTQYELIDFGQGRKLESFGSIVLDRPCPASEGIQRVNLAAWKNAFASYQKSQGPNGKWVVGNTAAAKAAIPFEKHEWSIAHRDARFSLRPTAFGHVGVFPEQATNWLWIAKQVKRCLQSKPDRPPRVLNLFAYTGGSSLAAAAAGAEVVHVDAAKTTVAWARQNAEASGLTKSPIRWIVEDAAKFVEREVKRGNQYEGIILDPPSYGHGPSGKPWKIGQHLLPLLKGCAELTRDTRQFILLTCHAPDFPPAEVEACLAQAVFGSCAAGATAKRLDLATKSGRKLNAGVVARWPS